MDEQLLEQILSLGSDEDAIAELLRQADRHEQIGDDTRGKDYLIGAGRINVANPWGAVSDMFVRGQSDKRAKALRDEAATARRKMDEKVGGFMNSAMGYGPGGAPLPSPMGTHVPVTPPSPASITPPAMPQVTPPPVAAPRPSQAAPAQPPSSTPPAGRPGPFVANLPQPEPSTDDLLAMLRAQTGGGLL